MVLLRSSDGKELSVEKDIVQKSVLIKNLLEDLGETEEAIPLPNVSEAILEKVLDYLRHHKDDPPYVEGSDNSSRITTESISEWDAEFCRVDQGTLFDIIMVSDAFWIICLFNCISIGC